MNKILFTHSYFYKFDPKSWQTRQPFPPLGTIIAASVLRNEGYEVALFDTNLKNSPDDIKPIINEFAPHYLVIYDDGFNYLTKMCLTNMREAAFKLIAIGKYNGCKVIISGSDSTDHYQEYLDKGVDFVIRGEAEVTLKELINYLEIPAGDIADVRGIYYKKDNEIQDFKERQLIEDIDSLPLPAWDLIDMESYRSVWTKGKRKFTLNIATTRGCQYRCNWCAKPIYGYSYNSRSPEKVLDEIAFLIQNYRVEEFWICDDIFGQKPGWLGKFNELIKQRRIYFSYIIQTRADLLQNEKTVKMLAESGCIKVWMGAESGSQKILDAMNKGIKTEQITNARKYLKKYRIDSAFFIQLGYLGETQADIDKTIKMILELMPDDIGISVSYPLPGTAYYEKVKKDLGEKSNWADSNDLDLMFINNFSSAYYRQLYKYIHFRFRIKKFFTSAIESIRNISFFKWSFVKTLVKIFYYTPLCMIAQIKLSNLSKKY
jgi:anaerobic magnesium-protoporphyrin IX monomethyl ester cyclase